MKKYDPVEAWINNVAVSHSDSIGTRRSYKSNLKRFCSFIDKTPEQIIQEYENSEDKQFRRKFAQYIRAFISSIHSKGLSPNTIASRIIAVKSFFKYSDLPLGYVPTAQSRVVFHNRDITHEEIRLILDASKPRERAFFTVMAQSGLRPHTICSLKYENIREDFDQERIPCKIDVPQEIAKGKYHSYFTFIGEEAVKYLHSYLSIRPDISDEDYIFLKQGTTEKASAKSLSKMFAQTMQKLKKKGLIEVKQKGWHKPRDVRLYNLRKWFRKHSHQAGFELVQFWMGHIVRAGQEEHYRPKDVEFHRKLYAEKAMPFLRLEKATPTETEKTIEELKLQLAERDKEMEVMKESFHKIQPLVEFVNTFNAPEDLKETLEWFSHNMIVSSYDQDVLFDETVAKQLDVIMKEKGITQKEALEELVNLTWTKLKERDKKLLERFEAAGVPITREDFELAKKYKNGKRKRAQKHARACIKG